MTQLDHFVRFHWREIVVINIFPQCIIAAIYSFKISVLISTIFVGFALVALVFGMSRILAKHESNLRVGAADVQVPHRGIIFTVGLKPGIIPMALNHHRPDFVAFICTSESDSIVEELISEFEYDSGHYKKKPVDPINIKEIRDETRILLDWMEEKGLQNDEIAADVTGGMVPMSLGVFSAAEERNIDCQYIKSEYDIEKNRPKEGTQNQVLISPQKELANR